ncbi:MAG TPA: hypothetical protein VHF27_01135 [Acidimicrobiales bacterium]|nr:hypothetical protein [Acidimicrobiales bacterium]
MAWRSRRAARLRGLVRVAPLAVGVVALVAFNVTAQNPVPGRTGVRHAEPGPGRDEVATPEEMPLPVGPVLGPWNRAWWTSVSSGAIDSTTLVAGGVAVPDGANVFAVRVVDGGPSPAYRFYQAGGGAFATEFYPASSIKVLAALGALELAYASGFTGQALVDGVYSLAEYYESAVRDSSNEDYDTLVRVAGVAWLNEQFLPSRGYDATRIQEAYAGGEGVTDSPPVHLAEEGREMVLPERSARSDYGCAAANCSTLFELVDSVRRVMLDDEIPAEERFAIAPTDVAGLQRALSGAESWIGAGVVHALGPGATLYSKPGWTSGYDCVDVGFVVAPESSGRYLIGVSAPDDGECNMLAPLAADVLSVLAGEVDGEALRSDGTLVPVVDGRQRPP